MVLIPVVGFLGIVVGFVGIVVNIFGIVVGFEGVVVFPSAVVVFVGFFEAVVCCVVPPVEPLVGTFFVGVAGWEAGIPFAVAGFVVVSPSVRYTYWMIMTTTKTL